MGLRFRKSKNFGPFRVTVSKSGISSSVGVKGFRVTKTAAGRVRTTASIPGTGISYVKETGETPKGNPAEREKNMNRGRSSKRAGTGCLIWILLIMALLGACVGLETGDKGATPSRTVVTLEETPRPRVTRRPAAAPTESPVLALIAPTPEPTPQPTPQHVYTFVVNTGTGKFHWPSCRSVAKMKESNKLIVEASRADLIARGYDPCGQCHP